MPPICCTITSKLITQMFADWILQETLVLLHQRSWQRNSSKFLSVGWSGGCSRFTALSIWSCAAVMGSWYVLLPLHEQLVWGQDLCIDHQGLRFRSMGDAVKVQDSHGAVVKVSFWCCVSCAFFGSKWMCKQASLHCMAQEGGGFGLPNHFFPMTNLQCWQYLYLRYFKLIELTCQEKAWHIFQD